MGLWFSIGAFLIPFDIFRKSATVMALCFFIRHFIVASCISLCTVAMWYQAGSWAFSWGVRHIAARLVLYVFATFNILLILLLILLFVALRVGMFQLCRKGLYSMSSSTCLGASS